MHQKHACLLVKIEELLIKNEHCFIPLTWQLLTSLAPYLSSYKSPRVIGTSSTYQYLSVSIEDGQKIG